MLACVLQRELAAQQGVRPPGKPGKVGEFDIGQGKSGKLGKVRDIVVCYRSCDIGPPIQNKLETDQNQFLWFRP